METTIDSLLGGSLLLEQPKEGYRFNQDSVHLAHFASERPCDSACDLGAGVGTVGLLLLRLASVRRVLGVERESALAELAQRNAERNQLGAHYAMFTGDVAAAPRSEASLVVMNPPYFQSGPQATHALRADARHGLLPPFVRAAKTQLGRRGRLCMVYPAEMLAAALVVLTAEQLVAKRIQFVHGTSARPARIVLIQAQMAKPGGLAVLPPVFEDSPCGPRAAPT